MQEDQTAVSPTEAVPEVVPTKRRSTRTSRGTKRKLEDELEQVGDIRLLPKKVKFPFELKDFSPAVSSLRQEREAFSGVFKSNLFKDVGRIYISSQCRVARTDLRELVELAGGRLVNTARVAEVVVGEFCHVGDSTSPHFVTDHWLLDSVQHHSVRPFLDYPLT